MGSRPRRGRWASTYIPLVEYGELYLTLLAFPKCLEDLRSKQSPENWPLNKNWKHQLLAASNWSIKDGKKTEKIFRHNHFRNLIHRYDRLGKAKRIITTIFIPKPLAAQNRMNGMVVQSVLINRPGHRGLTWVSCSWPLLEVMWYSVPPWHWYSRNSETAYTTFIHHNISTIITRSPISDRKGNQPCKNCASVSE